MDEAKTTDSFFTSLERRIAAVPDPPSMPPAGLVERYLIWVGFFAAGVTIALSQLIDGILGLWIAGIGLLVELVSFTVAIACWLRRNWSSLRHHKHAFAEGLDADYGPWRDIVSWLAGFGRDELAVRRRYLGMRRQTLTYKLGIFSGGIEKLGPLPLLAVLYIQFKDVELGTWAALGQVTFLGGFLLAALAVCYLMSMMFLGIKIRLETYEYLIDEALEVEAAAAKQSTVGQEPAERPQG